MVNKPGQSTDFIRKKMFENLEIFWKMEKYGFQTSNNKENELEH
jgi:hypothetical protein